MAKTQRQLHEVSLEVSRGRYADVGRVLGGQSGKAVEVRALAGEAAAIAQSNALTSSRLEQMQSALSSMAELAKGFFDAAVVARQSDGNRAQFIEAAKSTLATLKDLLSATSGGANIFSGVNTAVPPLDEYVQSPTGAARSAIMSSFTSEFGFPPGDPQSASIPKAQLDAYLDGAFKTNFQDPQWQANFSTASDVMLRSRISFNEVVETPVSANSAGIRSLVSALVAAIDTGAEELSSDAFSSLAGHASQTAAQAVAELTDSQASVGVVQARLAKASERMVSLQSLLEKQTSSLEEVDAYEAASRLNSLKIKLETSYAMTASLQRLSILDYL